MDLTAMHIRQNGVDIYVTVFRASTLLKFVKIDAWNEKTPTGYQRALSEPRIRRAVRYLIDEDGTFPTSILLNTRGKIDFKPSTNIGDGGELGVLTIPPNSLPFWVIDGQHRLMAVAAATLKKNEFQRYSVPVCIFNLTEKHDEMRQFYVVNSRQKSVPTDLVQRHLYQSIKERGEWQISPYETEKRVLAAEAIPIVDILNMNTKSPWYSRIQLPSALKKQTHVIKQTSMADSIGYILKSLSPIERDDVRKDPESLASLLIQYWSVIKSMFPEAFKDPRSYLIQKTLGVYVFHMIYPIIWRVCKVDEDFSVEKVRQILEEMLAELSENGKPINSDFWHRETGSDLVMGSSMKTFRRLASRLAAPFTFPED